MEHFSLKGKIAIIDCSYITGEDIYIDGGLKAGPSTQMIEALLNKGD